MRGDTLHSVLSYLGEEILIDIKHTKTKTEYFCNATLFRNVKHVGLGCYVEGH